MTTTPLQLSAGRRTGITIGNFDGVHRGHQKLIRRTQAICRAKNLDCVVITFWPHPRAFFSGNPMPPLADMATRRQMMGNLGINYMLELTFTRELASLTTEQFLERYLYPLNLAELVIGYDFRLGKGRSGDFGTLREIGAREGFGVEQVGPLMFGDAPVSSTRLRDIIAAGDMETARAMLGHPHGFSGSVIHGEGRGTGLGFPTANLAIPDVLLPPDGVYATRVRLRGKVWPSVTNIGFKPTFDGRERTIESFLLDCDLNLYGMDIRLDFLARLRDERRFSSSDELVAQIGRDIAQARAHHARALDTENI